MQPTNNTQPSTQTLLQALERKMGSDFIENLFEDFLLTDAYASFGFFTDMVSGAYASVRDPQFRLLVRGNADMFLNPADLSAENPTD
jgi:hypothetical protein